ncbi:hypothetical protein M0805_005918 [Coniferiporia weirii]|nr:hypothetical protein M0805_005918 [Coniferiporia weirii]
MASVQASQEVWRETERKKKYKQPSGLVANAAWRVWIWTETTFALSLMEPWEIFLIFAIFGITFIFVTVGMVRYFPHAIVSASRRAQYYFSGSDSLVDNLKDLRMSGSVEL